MGVNGSRPPQTKLPQFLIIGAMKAGTTTLYDDLSHVADIFLPPEKEPNDLIHPEVETGIGLARYSKKFDKAPDGALLGEASTAYSKRPTYPGVPERAYRVLGPALKIIYLTRDPIRRIVSHYNHALGRGEETRALNDAVLTDKTYVDYSRYEWQLEPWRAAFSERQILVLQLETYIRHRTQEFQRVCDFLGLRHEGAVPMSHLNASDGKLTARPGTMMGRLASSPLYLYRIKPLLPRRARNRLKRLVLPQAGRSAERLASSTEAELRRRLAVSEP